MLGSGILDVAIGVIFVFLLVSLLCSAVREGLEAWLKTRAAYLEYGIRELLHDPRGEGLAAKFFKHPLIYGLYAGDYERGRIDRQPGWFEKGRNLPSYIPARNVALALLDIAARGPSQDILGADPAGPVLSLAAVRANVLNLQNPAVQRVLLTAIDTAQGDIDRVRSNREAWYDGAMERVGGWYKRSTQWVILSIALVVVIAGNVNVIVIATYLHHNDATRAALIERAKVATTDAAVLDRSYGQTRELLAEVELPIGWSNGFLAYQRPEKVYPSQWRRWLAVGNDALVVTFGWLLTAIAATLGAPFWFDVLKRVMSIRATLKGDVGPEPPPAPPTGGRAPPAAASPASSAFQAPRDADSENDGCQGPALAPGEATLDEQLPAATGGVA